MKGWEINALEYEEEKRSGICPNCGSSDVKCEEIIIEDRRSLSFLCRNCGSGDHFDGFVEKG